MSAKIRRSGYSILVRKYSFTSSKLDFSYKAGLPSDAANCCR